MKMEDRDVGMDGLEDDKIGRMNKTRSPRNIVPKEYSAPS